VGAEEFDLAEQARDDSVWAELRVMYGPIFEEDAPVAENTADPEAPNEAERPRMTQVVGLVEHLLGGRFIADA